MSNKDELELKLYKIECTNNDESWTEWNTSAYPSFGFEDEPDFRYVAREATADELSSYEEGLNEGLAFGEARSRMETWNGVTFTLPDHLGEGDVKDFVKTFRCATCHKDHIFEYAAQILNYYLTTEVVNEEGFTNLWHVCVECATVNNK